MTRVGVVFAVALAAVIAALSAHAVVSSDTVAPSLTAGSPVPGSTVSGVVSVAVTSSDNIGVVGVQFKLDGANLGPENTGPSYGTSWNSATATNGAHTVSATSRDAAGNTASVIVPVTVSNSAPPPPPPPPPPGPITVKKIFEGSDSDRQVHYFALTAAVPAGDTILLAHASTVDDVTGGIVTPNGVKNARGNQWAQDGVYHPGTSFATVELWSAYVSTALQAGDLIEVDGYPRGLSSELSIFDVAGLAGPSQAARLDQHAGSSGYASTQSSPLVTTAQPHELLVGVHSQHHMAAAWWSPEAQSPSWTKWTDRMDNGIGDGIAVVIREVTVQGSYRSRGTLNSAVNTNNLIVTYKAAR